jgi:Na+/glutamate symporter
MIVQTADPHDREEHEMRDLLQGFMTDARFVLLMATGLMAIVFVITTWVRTRSAIPTVGALLLGAIVVAGVNRMSTFQTVAEKDIDRYTEVGQ